MKFALTLGAAFAALTLAASAHSDSHNVFVRHHGTDLNIDADGDGWITRSEAAAAFDRAFDQMDSNNDGRLTSEDHAALQDFDVRVDGPHFRMHAPDVHVLEGEDDGERRVRIIRRGENDEEVEREIERAMAQAERAIERAERDVERAERQAERAERLARDAERHAERAARDAERHTSREVVIIRGEGGEWHGAEGMIAPLPPVPAVPAVPPAPMFMLLIANSEEADLDGDGALSREEFRNQHLRFFDASDANGDGRVRFERPPEPPTPPAPPAPPEPARRR